MSKKITIQQFEDVRVTYLSPESRDSLPAVNRLFHEPNISLSYKAEQFNLKENIAQSHDKLNPENAAIIKKIFTDKILQSPLKMVSDISINYTNNADGLKNFSKTDNSFHSAKIPNFDNLNVSANFMFHEQPTNTGIIAFLDYFNKLSPQVIHQIHGFLNCTIQEVKPVQDNTHEIQEGEHIYTLNIQLQVVGVNQKFVMENLIRDLESINFNLPLTNELNLA